MATACDLSRTRRMRCLVLSLSCVVLWHGTLLNADDGIRYIGPRYSEGSSGAIVVPDWPLAHTAQFLPLDSRFQVAEAGNAKGQIEMVLAHLNDTVTANGDPGLKSAIVKLNLVAANSAVVQGLREAVRRLCRRWSSSNGRRSLLLKSSSVPRQRRRGSKPDEAVDFMTPAASKVPVTGTGREGRTITLDMISAPKLK